MKTELEQLRSENQRLLDHMKIANETAASMQVLIESQLATIATQNAMIEQLKAAVVDAHNREQPLLERVVQLQAFYDASVADQLSNLPPGEIQ